MQANDLHTSLRLLPLEKNNKSCNPTHPLRITPRDGKLTYKD